MPREHLHGAIMLRHGYVLLLWRDEGIVLLLEFNGIHIGASVV